MNYKQIKKTLAPIVRYCDQCLPNKEELGEKAMELIGEYPLYVSGLSNITYGEAIAIATLLFGDIEEAYNGSKEQDDLMREYFADKTREHSLEDYDKWVAEKKGAKHNG